MYSIQVVYYIQKLNYKKNYEHFYLSIFRSPAQPLKGRKGRIYSAALQTTKITNPTGEFYSAMKKWQIPSVSGYNVFHIDGRYCRVTFMENFRS
jgi:hypothetical protein